MKLQLYTKDASPYTYKSTIDLMGDENVFACIQNNIKSQVELDKFLNSDYVTEILWDFDWSILLM